MSLTTMINNEFYNLIKRFNMNEAYNINLVYFKLELRFFLIPY